MSFNQDFEPEKREDLGSQYYNAQNYPSSPQTGGNRVYIVAVEENDNYYDPRAEDDIQQLMKFQDRSQRMLFVRRVLGLVGLQFLACALFMALCFFEDNTRRFFEGTYGHILALLSMIIWFVLYCAIGCCRVGHGKPNFTNVSLFILSTGLLSVYSGAIIAQFHDAVGIMIAAATTVGVVLVLALITFNSKFDITSKIVYIIGASLAVILFSFFVSILVGFGVITDFKTRTILSLILSLLFAMIFAVFILYQLKLIVGGGRAEYDEDDWLLASISLFYYILQFFLEMLNLTRYLGR